MSQCKLISSTGLTCSRVRLLKGAGDLSTCAPITITYTTLVEFLSIYFVVTANILYACDGKITDKQQTKGLHNILMLMHTCYIYW